MLSAFVTFSSSRESYTPCSFLPLSSLPSVYLLFVIMGCICIMKLVLFVQLE